MEIRYIRDYVNGSSSNAGDHWVQIAAWDINRTNQSLVDSNSNRAYNKPVSASAPENTSYPISRVTNGNIDTYDYAGLTSSGNQYVKIDLGALYDIEFIQVWHYYADTRIYYHHRLDVSVDNTNWFTIQAPSGNSIETSSGITYMIAKEDHDKQYATKSDRDMIIAAVNSALAARGLSGVSISADDQLNFGFASEFKNALSDFNIIWNNDTIQKLDNNTIEEIFLNIKRVQSNASCRESCQYECSDNCSKKCFGTCGSGCGNNCSGTCGGACDGGCGSGCTASCYAACSIACSASCVTTCSGTCARTGTGS